MLSPGTMAWATPQHPTRCAEEEHPGKGWRSLRAVTTLEPIISRARVLSPCRLPPRKPVIPGQTEWAGGNHTALFISRIFAGGQEETGRGWGGLN